MKARSKEIKKIIKECKIKHSTNYKKDNTFVVFGVSIYNLLKTHKYNKHYFFLRNQGKKRMQCVAKNYKTGCTYYLNTSIENNTIMRARKSEQTELGVIYAPYVLNDKVQTITHDSSAEKKLIETKYTQKLSDGWYYAPFKY